MGHLTRFRAGWDVRALCLRVIGHARAYVSGHQLQRVLRAHVRLRRAVLRLHVVGSVQRRLVSVGVPGRPHVAYRWPQVLRPGACAWRLQRRSRHA